MDLREYLFRQRISVTDFAKLIGCSRAYISKIVNDQIRPGKRLAKDIELITNGEVTAEELLKGKKENE